MNSKFYNTGDKDVDAVATAITKRYLLPEIKSM